MKFKALLVTVALPFALTACGNAKEDEARRLGFSDAADMETAQSKGWHTNAQYVADETERAHRFGFNSIDEMHRADDAGVKTKAAYDKYLVDLDIKNEEFAKNEAAKATKSDSLYIGQSTRSPEVDQDALAAVEPRAAAPEDLTDLSYGELSIRLRAREKECDKSFGKNDGKINDQQKSCYSKYKIIYTDACYEKDEIAKRDCATAANLKQCLDIKHPQAATNIFISGCLAL